MEQINTTQDYVINTDPLLRFLCTKLKLSNNKIILLILILTCFVFFGLGGIASWVYTGSGNRITSFGNLSFLISWVILFIPLMWGPYLWQSRATTSLILKLAQGQSFGTPTSDNCKKAINLAKQVYTSLTHPSLYFLAVLTVIGFWSIEIAVEWPEQLRLNSEYWYEVKWYLPLHILAWSITLYPLFLLSYRQIVFVAGLANILRKIEIEIKPLDPDECGGLGEIGEFIKVSVFFAIGIGLLAVVFGIMLYITGSEILRRPAALGLFGMYVILAPLCLFVPLISSRGAMIRARNKALLPIAREFQEVLKLTREEFKKQPSEIKELNERLVQIQQHRDIVLKNFPISPLSLGALQRLSISATIPLISGVASLVIQLLSNQP